MDTRTKLLSEKSACLRIQVFAFIPLWGISQGFQPAIGTNIPVMCFPKTMLSLFITDPNNVLMGINSLRLIFSTYILLGVMILSITLFQSLGKGCTAAVLTLLRQILFFIPLALILPKIYSLGIHGVFLAPVLTDIGVLILSFILIAREFVQRGKLDK